MPPGRRQCTYMQRACSQHKKGNKRRRLNVVPRKRENRETGSSCVQENGRQGRGFGRWRACSTVGREGGRGGESAGRGEEEPSRDQSENKERGGLPGQPHKGANQAALKRSINQSYRPARSAADRPTTTRIVAAPTRASRAGLSGRCCQA